VKEPQHAVGIAFHRAADNLSAWREQQKARLSEEQRERYEEIIREGERIKEERGSELAISRQRRIDDEKRRLLERPTFALRMHVTHARKENYAVEHAVVSVDARDLAEIDRLHHEQQARGDDYLERAEKERRDKSVTERFNENAARREYDRDRDRDDGPERDR
jgi:hypothetical protein